MRLLFSTFPGLGHFFPIVPLAWAARAAGHETLIVTAGPALAAAGQAGLPAVDAAPGVDLWATMRDRLALAGTAPTATFRDALSDRDRPHVAAMMGGISDRI